MWTDLDRDLLLALTAEEAETCGGCGNPLEVSLDGSTMHTWQVIKETCRACEVLEATRENDAEAGRKYGVKYATGRRNG